MRWQVPGKTVLRRMRICPSRRCSRDSCRIDGGEAGVQVLVHWRADDNHKEPALAHQVWPVLDRQSAGAEDASQHLLGALPEERYLAGADLLDRGWRRATSTPDQVLLLWLGRALVVGGDDGQDQLFVVRSGSMGPRLRPRWE
jgi:hypothetical protein